MLFTYFASFVVKDATGERKFGNTVFDLTAPIKGIKQIEMITNSLKEQYEVKELIILNFQLINQRAD